MEKKSSLPTVILIIAIITIVIIGVVIYKHNSDKTTTSDSETSVQSEPVVNDEKQQYVGTYKNSSGEDENISIKQNGELCLTRKFDGKDVIDLIDINKKDKDGSIIVFDNEDKQGVYKIVIYPVGVSIPVDNLFEYKDEEIDTNKIRIVSYNDIEGGTVTCKVD